jgi:hypothetical protein
MNKEQLIALGVAEDIVQKVLDAHKSAIDGNYVPKATFDAEREKSKNLQEQVTERDNQIAELGKFKGTAEELQIKVSDLTKQNEDMQKNYDAKVAEIEKQSAINLSVSPLVNDISDILPKLDMSKIVIKDGKIESGLDDQIEAIKKSNPYYFKQSENQNQNQFQGWLFGNKPEEGNTGGTQKTGAEFGAELAKSRMATSTIADKVNEHYFK